ncbi:hypothetical protein TIFTF001_026557 [Ficus carica]|uniref:CID domain-containing protein n=1 Tax=Ficus carica TaxID=3494 RepID=A0AA88DLI5_FICCA|nr:hypothetical protein TIFTF001_026557 [Ficus carica]
MNKARQVVETWDRQFHCSPRDQRLAFLYLANDILQNSRRKGSEFVGEFWKVLPDALRDVTENGDEFGRNAALRLKHSAGSTLDKIVSGYQVVYGQMDEDVIVSKCRNAINFVEKVDKEISSDIKTVRLILSGKLVCTLIVTMLSYFDYEYEGRASGTCPIRKFHGSTLVEELQGQNSILQDCIEQLTTVESSRASLVSLLRDALREQEFKLDQVRNQLQAAQSQSEQASSICRQLVGRDNMPSSLAADHGLKEVHTSVAPHGFIAGDKEQSAPVMYAHAAAFPEKSGHMEEDPRKSAAAAVAAKLTASTSSAQMLSYVLSSLASEGVICNTVKESPGDYPSEKRPKLENDQSSYVPQNPQPPPVPPFPHPDSSQQFNPNEPPPPPSSSPPPLPPLPPMPQYPVPLFMQTATGSMANVPYSYSMTQPPPTMSGYPAVVGAPVNGVSPYATTPPNPYQGFQGPDGNFYSQPSSMPMAPMSRQ